MHLTKICGILSGALLLGWGGHVLAQGSQQVTIRFRAMVGDQPFACGRAYRLGATQTLMAASDFRFYVSEVALLDAAGKAVPLNLAQDGKWQHQNVALLDFEDRSASCANGTRETRDRVVGTVPAGSYRGLRFRLGIPADLNHKDATLAPSPLNLTSLWWNWRGGYKFARIDLEAAKIGGLNLGQPAHAHDHKGFPIHLGSTGCQSTSQNQPPSACSNPNTVEIRFNNFDPNQNGVVADLAALVADTNLSQASTKAGPGCMSSPDDDKCSRILANFGIGSEQKFFRLQ